MTTYTVPTSVVYNGQTFLMPGHASYVAGTDVTDPLLYWLTRDPNDETKQGIGADKFTLRSGTEADPTIIQFRDATYWCEYGNVIGAGITTTTKTDKNGVVWPAIPSHAWKYTTFRGGSVDLTTFRQAENTTYDDGVRTGRHCDVVTDGTTQGTVITNLSPALVVSGNPTATATLQARAVGGHINAVGPDGKSLFTGGAKGAEIASVSADGTQVFLAKNNAKSSMSNTLTTIYLLPNEPRKNPGVIMWEVSAPGAVNGQERAAMTHHITFEDFTVIGGNTAGAQSVYTDYEFFHAFSFRGCDTVVVQDVMLRNIWGDFFFFTGKSQSGVPGYADAGSAADNVTIRDSICLSNGRHALTMQGNIGTLVERVVFHDVGRLVWDTETTSPDQRIFATTLRSVAADPGTAFWHASPASLSGEPLRSLAGVVTRNGDPLIDVPYDMVDSDNFGGIITGTGIPAGTYIRRRFSPTSIELSQPCTASGTITVTIAPGVTFRDMTFDKVSVYQGQGLTLTGDVVCPGSLVYFEGDTVTGSNTVTNIVFAARSDGLTFTTADLNGVKIHYEGQLFAGSADVVTGYTSNTVTITKTAAATTAGDRTIANCTTTAGLRNVTTTTAGSFTVLDKGHTLSGLGSNPGWTVQTIQGAKQVTMNRPALTTQTGTLTMSGKARFWATIGPATWSGLSVVDCRNIGTGKWTGESPVLPGVGKNQPMVLVPQRWDNVTVARNYGWAARNSSNQVAKSMVGSFVWPAQFPLGAPSGLTWAIANNRWPDAVDDQVSTPTVTVTNVLTINSATSSRPTLTATLARSDAGSLEGHAVRFMQNGQTAAIGFVQSGVATARAWDTSPNGVYSWQAEWAGSYDTLASNSNTVTQTVGSVSQTPTTLTLTTSPTSPQNVGTTVALVATISPNPGNGETVTFTDDGTTLGTAVTSGGVATLSGQTFAAGVHGLSATFAGSSTFAGSTGTAQFTSDAVNPPDTTAPTVLTVSPADRQTDVAETAIVTVTFSEAVTDVVLQVRTGDQTTEILSGTVAGSGTTWTFTPAPPFMTDHRYTVVVNDAVDAAGNHMTGRFSSTFDTVVTDDPEPYGPVFNRSRRNRRWRL